MVEFYAFGEAKSHTWSTCVSFEAYRFKYFAEIRTWAELALVTGVYDGLHSG
jgi:hypothetical protein